jgi:hypothetical protein
VTTERTDIYALGATTYYALTGRQPWDATRRLSELHQGNGDMPMPSEWMPDISEAADAVVMQALNLNPAQRFSSAALMGQALEAALTYATKEQAAVSCPNCGAGNTASAEFCGTCGTALKAARSVVNAAPVATAPAAPLVPPVARPEPARQATLPVPSRPEPVAPRIPVNIRPKASVLAGLALFLSIFTLCPAGGPVLSLVVIPMGVRAQRNIRRSKGTLTGTVPALIGVLVAIASLVGYGFYLYLLFTRKINGPGA